LGGQIVTASKARPKDKEKIQYGVPGIVMLLGTRHIRLETMEN